MFALQMGFPRIKVIYYFFKKETFEEQIFKRKKKINSKTKKQNSFENTQDLSKKKKS